VSRHSVKGVAAPNALWSLHTSHETRGSALLRIDKAASHLSVILWWPIRSVRGVSLSMKEHNTKMIGDYHRGREL